MLAGRLGEWLGDGSGGLLWDLPGGLSLCSASKQANAAPFLPNQLVCKHAGFTGLVVFPVWGPSQQQGAGLEGMA